MMLMRFARLFLLTFFMTLFMSSTLVSNVMGQGDPIPQAPPEAAFVAYQCEFRADTNSAYITAVLMGADGRPIPRETFTLSAAIRGTEEALPANRLTVERIPTREPLQMIIVLDITDTVPILEVVQALTDQLPPRLDVRDEVALITFSQEISPRTQFYTDKNRLINEHMTDLLTLEGDNRLYDAIFEAADSFPFSADKRQVVLVLTDSNRRDTLQTQTNQIIARAQRSKIQVYPIGFFSRDRPDVAELQQIAAATGGYAWIYDETRNSRASIGTAVSGFLGDFVDTLDSEIGIVIDLQGQTPDANGLVEFDLTVDSENDAVLTDRITCPIEVLEHSVSFVDNDLNNTILTGRADIGVNVESDLSDDEISVVFRVNNDVVQNGDGRVFTFDATRYNPGTYTIGAQIWDRDNQTLATTPNTIRLNVQASLPLTISPPQTGEISGEVTLSVAANPDFELPPVAFDVHPTTRPTDVKQLAGRLVAFENGIAALTIPDIQAEILRLFPEEPENQTYVISARMSSITAGEPDPATTNTLNISIEPPPAPAPAVVVPRFNISELLPWLAVIGLLAFNLLLMRMVGRARVRRLIRMTDKHDLSPQLMTITMRRDGIKQSHTLTKKTVHIGRGSSNDINLGDDPNISRQHGVIMWRKRNWYYANRKSRTMTRINGKRYRGLKLFKLRPVTELEIGGTLLIFHSNAQQDVSEFIKTNL